MAGVFGEAKELVAILCANEELVEKTVSQPMGRKPVGEAPSRYCYEITSTDGISVGGLRREQSIDVGPYRNVFRLRGGGL